MDLMNGLASFDAADLKLIYRVLHKGLLDDIELMDSEFMASLQSWLRTLAASEGVDTSDHALWDAWLGGKVVPCEQRLADRRRLSLV